MLELKTDAEITEDDPVAHLIKTARLVAQLLGGSSFLAKVYKELIEELKQAASDAEKTTALSPLANRNE